MYILKHSSTIHKTLTFMNEVCILFSLGTLGGLHGCQVDVVSLICDPDCSFNLTVYGRKPCTS